MALANIEQLIVERCMKWLLAALMFTASLAAQAAAPDYLLGAGDVIRITVYQYQDLTTETRVSESGIITFPMVGTVNIAGETTVEAEKKIVKLLEEGGFIKQPQVNIEIIQFRSQQISVLGQVNRPGKYPVETVSKVTDLLALAGGIAGAGADEVVLLRPAGDGVTRYTLDSLKLFEHGDATQDMEVKNGDVIYVPRMPLFYIYGEVQRPGSFRLENNMTVMQALSLGGGLTPRGTQRGIKIMRNGTDGKPVSIDVKLTDTVQINDVIYVQETLF